MNMDIATVVLICLIVGAVARTGSGFMQKIVKSTEAVAFDVKYAATLGISLVSTCMLAVGAFMVFPLPQDVPIAYAVGSALLAGYAVNDAVNDGVTTYQSKPSATPASVSPANPPASQFKQLFRWSIGKLGSLWIRIKP